MSKVDRTHFKNLAVFAAIFLSMFDHFWRLCIKRLKLKKILIFFLANPFAREEFEKWCAIRASVGGVGDVLAC